VAVQAKTGATIAPVFGGTRQLPLLAALFLPALSSFLCHFAFIPPFVWDSLRRAFTVSPRCCLSGTSAGRLPALHASLLRSRTLIAREVGISMAARMVRVFAVPIGGQKNRGCKVALHTPRSGRQRLALLAALFLAALCGFLRHAFLLGTRLPS
jgi:hypothetical protein